MNSGQKAKWSNSGFVISIREDQKYFCFLLYDKGFCWCSDDMKTFFKVEISRILHIKPSIIPVVLDLIRNRHIEGLSGSHVLRKYKNSFFFWWGCFCMFCCLYFFYLFCCFFRGGIFFFCFFFSVYV